MMYDPFNVIAYSTDRTLVGKKGLGGTDFKKAMVGKYTSRLISEEVFWKIRPGGRGPDPEINNHHSFSGRTRLPTPQSRS